MSSYIDAELMATTVGAAAVGVASASAGAGAATSSTTTKYLDGGGGNDRASFFVFRRKRKHDKAQHRRRQSHQLAEIEETKCKSSTLSTASQSQHSVAASVLKPTTTTAAAPSHHDQRLSSDRPLSHPSTETTTSSSEHSTPVPPLPLPFPNDRSSSASLESLRRYHHNPPRASSPLSRSSATITAGSGGAMGTSGSSSSFRGGSGDNNNSIIGGGGRSRTTSSLKFDRLQSALFGREAQREQLWGAYQRVLNRSSSCADGGGDNDKDPFRMKNDDNDDDNQHQQNDASANQTIHQDDSATAAATASHDSTDPFSLPKTPAAPSTTAAVLSTNFDTNNTNGDVTVATGAQYMNSLVAGKTTTTNSNTSNNSRTIDSSSIRCNTAANLSSSDHSCRTLETVFIRGRSGVGKSFLVEDFRRRVAQQQQQQQQRQNSVAFLQAHHILSSSSSPFGGDSIDAASTACTASTINGMASSSDRGDTSVDESFVAFRNILTQLLAFLLDLHDQSKGNDDVQTSMRAFAKKLYQSLNNKSSSTTKASSTQSPLQTTVMQQEFPGLEKLLSLSGYERTGPSDDDVGSSTSKASEVVDEDRSSVKRQFGLFFLRFLRLMAQLLPSVTVVLVVDDLQWADAESLDLISSLIGETRLRNFLLIASFRDGDSETMIGHHDGISICSVVMRKNYKRHNRQSESSDALPPRLASTQSFSLSLRNIPRMFVANRINGQGRKHKQETSRSIGSHPLGRETELTYLSHKKRAVTLGSDARPPTEAIVSLSTERSANDVEFEQTNGIPIRHLTENALGTPPLPGKRLSLIDDDESESDDNFNSIHAVPLVPPPVSFGRAPSPVDVPQPKSLEMSTYQNPLSSSVSTSFSPSRFRAGSKQNLSRNSIHSDASNDDQSHFTSHIGPNGGFGDGSNTSARLIASRLADTRRTDSSDSLVTPLPKLRSSRTQSFAASMFGKFQKISVSNKVRSHFGVDSKIPEGTVVASGCLKLPLNPDLMLQRFSILDIALGTWDVEVISQVLSRLLNLEKFECKTLAIVAERKTQGNPNSLMKFIGFLERDGLLTFSMRKNRWVWDANHINAETMATSDVGELLAARVKYLPPESLSVLKLAACIGISFELAVLEQISERSNLKAIGEGGASVTNEKTIFLKRVLAESCDAGLLERGNESVYRFSHDLIQQNLYTQVDEGNLYAVHYQIGKIMLNLHCTETDLSTSNFLFACANHIFLGKDAITSDIERIKGCELHLQASIAAKDQGSFRAAAIFLERIMGLFFSKNDWSDNYSLVLEVYSSAAEILFSCGDLEKSMYCAEQVIKNASSVEDRLRGYFVKIDVLSTERHFTAAIEESSKLLRVLGCRVTTRWRRFRVIFDLFEIKKELVGKDLNSITAMKPLRNILLLSALRVMDTMTLLLALRGDDEMGNVILTKMVLTTLKSGMSVYAPYSLAGYGMLLVHSGDFDNGYRYSELSLHLAESFRSKRALVRTAFLVYTFLSWIRRPLTEGIEVMLNAHRMGMRVGDLEHSSMCLCTYACLYTAVGLPLKPFAEDMKQYLEQLELYRQNQCVALMMCYHQISLNLIGESNSYLSGFHASDDGEAMQLESFHDRFFTQCGNASDQGITFVNLKFATLLLSYIFQDIQMLETWFLSKMPWEGVLSRSHFLHMYMALFSGLGAFAIFRKTKKRKFYRKAAAIVLAMEKLARNAGMNVLPLYQLLLAVKTSVSLKDSRTVQQRFDEAIATLARCGLIHLEAIACERAGDWMALQGNEYWARVYYGRSIERYEEWGAFAKANALSSARRTTEGDKSHHESKRSDSVKLNLRGKRRFDPVSWSTIEKVDVAKHGSEHLRKTIEY